MLQQILKDPSVRIWLPTKYNDMQQHVVEVVDSLLLARPSLRFKVGIAVCALSRYWHSGYGYCLPESHLRDGVRYEGMHVVWMHQTRMVVAMAEHCLENYFLVTPMYQHKCANVKSDIDDHVPGDESDDERPTAPGPHTLYISWGEPGPKYRKSRRLLLASCVRKGHGYHQ